MRRVQCCCPAGLRAKQFSKQWPKPFSAIADRQQCLSITGAHRIPSMCNGYCRLFCGKCALEFIRGNENFESHFVSVCLLADIFQCEVYFWVWILYATPTYEITRYYLLFETGLWLEWGSESYVAQIRSRLGGEGRGQQS